MFHLFKGNIRRGRVLRMQILEFCLLSSISTLIACLVGFDRLGIALMPAATLVVVFIPKNFNEMSVAVREAIYFTDLTWLKVQCFAANRRVARATSGLRLMRVKMLRAGD